MQVGYKSTLGSRGQVPLSWLSCEWLQLLYIIYCRWRISYDTLWVWVKGWQNSSKKDHSLLRISLLAIFFSVVLAQMARSSFTLLSPGHGPRRSQHNSSQWKFMPVEFLSQLAHPQHPIKPAPQLILLCQLPIPSPAPCFLLYSTPLGTKKYF